MLRGQKFIHPLHPRWIPISLTLWDCHTHRHTVGTVAADSNSETNLTIDECEYSNTTCMHACKISITNNKTLHAYIRQNVLYCIY